MSFDNSQCPCGGKKPPGNMLCDECVATFSDRRELKKYKDGTLPTFYRRNAAIILLSLARKRKRGAKWI